MYTQVYYSRFCPNIVHSKKRVKAAEGYLYCQKGLFFVVAQSNINQRRGWTFIGKNHDVICQPGLFVRSLLIQIVPK